MEYNENWHPNKRPQKEDARTYALAELKRKSHTLWLPGGGCHCINEALTSRVVNSRGHFIFVEKDKSIVPLIKRFVNKNEWKNQPVIYEGELSNLELPWSLDFAFIDLLGTFERKVAFWMAEKLKFTEGADLCVTHAYGRRYNLFLDELEKVIVKMPQYEALEIDLGCFDHLMMIPLAMMKSMFNKYSFDTRWPMKYRDSVRTMLLFKLVNFQRLDRGTNGWPSFAELVSQIEKPVKAVKAKPVKVKSKKEVFSDRAKKAWETRKRMQLI